MEKILKPKNEKINRNLMLIKGYFKSLLALPIFVISSCSSDEKQTVAQFTELVMQDEFTIEGALIARSGLRLRTGNDDTGAGGVTMSSSPHTNRTVKS
jgi:hypothetical protein